ncbi:CWC16 protein [Lasiosphaeria ovina]|uniref:CWC16 protein n=1 Tax=Lasiosphaeria ovina TaxID=92902 RepID=A0AAE0NMS0_9PEZI|nr:CWC16 protein [Lasiosphaeria ovina]
MQGFNMGRYVPPDQEGVVSGNKLNKKHALGARAAKLASQGILTVRFEMPFAVWCEHCPKPTVIGQGVRFNAEKKRVGSYFTTPIWSFRMRHTACGGEIDIHTDPQNTAYIVVSGGKRRDTGGDNDDSLVKAGEFVITTAAERAEQRETAFGKLEQTIADRQRLLDATHRVGELHDAAARQWDDPYFQNQRLRKAFRVGRHEREKDAATTEDLRDRMSLGIELLPGTEDDARRAALIDFGGPDMENDGPVTKALARPLFERTTATDHQGKQKVSDEGRRSRNIALASKKTAQRKLKAEVAASKMRESLVSEIVGNTRAARDPFLDFGSSKDKDTPKGTVLIPGLKRKRGPEEVPRRPPDGAQEPRKAVAETTTTNALVNYNSDSD